MVGWGLTSSAGLQEWRLAKPVADIGATVLIGCRPHYVTLVTSFLPVALQIVKGY
jgi:hypothetical protein